MSTASSSRRDQRSPSDCVKIIVDSYNDKRSAYEFAVNPVGVKTDRYYFNDGNSDDSSALGLRTALMLTGEAANTAYRLIRTDGTFDETNTQVDKLIAMFTDGKSRA